MFHSILAGICLVINVTTAFSISSCSLATQLLIRDSVLSAAVHVFMYIFGLKMSAYVCVYNRLIVYICIFYNPLQTFFFCCLIIVSFHVAFLGLFSFFCYWLSVKLNHPISSGRLLSFAVTLVDSLKPGWWTTLVH